MESCTTDEAVEGLGVALRTFAERWIAHLGPDLKLSFTSFTPILINRQSRLLFWMSPWIVTEAVMSRSFWEHLEMKV